MWAKNKHQDGFTIVELLIVIVVIGILAAITIVAYGAVQEKAKVSRANSALQLLQKAVMVGRLNTNQTMVAMTGSNCTRCSSQAQYQLTMDRIGAASGTNLASLKSGDPWGNNYSIDENEGEGGSCANRDSISVFPARAGVVSVVVPFYQC